MPDEGVTRLPFWQAFSPLPDGSLQLQVDLTVNGLPFRTGTVVRQGEFMGGIDINKRRASDLAVVALPGGGYFLRGFYLPNGQQ